MIPFKLLVLMPPFLKFDLIKIAQLMTKLSVIVHTRKHPFIYVMNDLVQRPDGSKE